MRPVAVCVSACHGPPQVVRHGAGHGAWCGHDTGKDEMGAPIVTGAAEDMEMAAGAARRACQPRRPRAQVPAAAATQTAGTSGSGTLPALILALGYFTKYQFSGLMASVGLCGRTPFRLLAISVRA